MVLGWGEIEALHRLLIRAETALGWVVQFKVGLLASDGS